MERTGGARARTLAVPDAAAGGRTQEPAGADLAGAALAGILAERSLEDVGEDLEAAVGVRWEPSLGKGVELALVEHEPWINQVIGDVARRQGAGDGDAAALQHDDRIGHQRRRSRLSLVWCG